MGDLYEKLGEIMPNSHIKCEEPMRKHTTFRIGGPAEFFAAPAAEEELVGAVNLCRQQEVPWYVIGNGSNLLVGDQGCKGVVLSTENLNHIEISGEEVRAQSGVLLSRLAKAAAKESLQGLEFAAGIPGSLGGAVVMNAGAYGSEMKDVLLWARVLDREGQIRRLTVQELELGYRASCVERKGYVVLEAGVRLRGGERSEILDRMEELAKRRQEKQPLEYPSAGSTFKRPKGYFAGKLIDDAGLRGFRIGDAQVSEKHCGFVVNRGNATAGDVLALCEAVKNRVAQKFGVEMELEIKRL